MNEPIRIQHHFRRWLAYAQAAIFVLALWLPFLDRRLSLDPAPKLKENREKTDKPSLRLSATSIRSYPADYEAYFNDRLGFRKSLIRYHHIIRVVWLSMSPNRLEPSVAAREKGLVKTNLMFLVGRKRWLFFTGEDDCLYNDMRGLDPFTDEQLTYWVDCIRARNAWLAERGIRYIFTIAPDKHSIYRENMPPSVRPVTDRHRADQLMAALRAVPELTVVEIKSGLLPAHEPELVYGQNETHWNEVGAYVAYTELMKPLERWFPELRTKPREDFTLSRKRIEGGDLAILAGLRDYLEMDWSYLIPKTPFKARESPADIFDEENEDRPAPYRMTIRENPDAPAVRALIIGDSFSRGFLQRLLTEHFRRTLCYWDRLLTRPPSFDLNIAAREKPDVMIEEWVERDLMTFLPTLPPKEPLEALGATLEVADPPVLHIDGSSSAKLIKSPHQIELRAGHAGGEKAWIAHCLGADPWMILPSFDRAPGTPLRLELEITSSHADPVKIDYLVQDEAGYSERRSLKQTLRVGRQRLSFDLADLKLIAPLRFGLGTQPGQYLIHEISIFAEPRR